jgi:amino acid adenylation domain-containing protein
MTGQSLTYSSSTLPEQNANAATLPLTESEQQQLATWNATRQDYPQDMCIPQLVAERVATTPDAIALTMSDKVLSYRELNRRANQLAHYLQTFGVRPNVLVGLCVERSMDMVVGLLGILKAGGAYVPIDPDYPAERIAFMLADAQTPVLVTQQHLAGHLPIQDMQIVYLDSGESMLIQQSPAEPTNAATLDDLAYVIYTSGSTGRPKGVQITHSNLLNLVFWHQRAFAVTSTDRATQVASPAFDATGWELWPYLTAGASVYLIDEETRLSPALLRDWLVHNHITISFLPTALAESVIGLDWPATTSLRFLLTGADTLHHYPSPTLPFALINNYGPTEATVVTTSGRVLPTAHSDEPPSIGRPIDNVHVYILDEHLRQTSIGESGELYIGGAGVAQGYLNRPDLTAESFIADPFSNDPHARLYKTGDRARYLPDGQIAFLGRTDYQIKIRGYRIEPDEIMSALHEHLAVQTSLVMAREDIPGDKRLVAYLVLAPQAKVTARDLQDMLAARLPDYMVPATFVVMEALPLTANGKIDRTSLPVPNATKTLEDEVIAAPSTPTEEQLISILAPLLNLEQVGIDDNFFMLGGHSLLGTQLIARIAETFGVTLSLRTLFDAPTVWQLAAEIEQRLIAQIEAMSDEEVQRLLGSIEHSRTI